MLFFLFKENSSEKVKSLSRHNLVFLDLKKHSIAKINLSFLFGHKLKQFLVKFWIFAIFLSEIRDTRVKNGLNWSQTKNRVLFFFIWGWEIMMITNLFICSKSFPHFLFFWIYNRKVLKTGVSKEWRNFYILAWSSS